MTQSNRLHAVGGGKQQAIKKRTEAIPCLHGRRIRRTDTPPPSDAPDIAVGGEPVGQQVNIWDRPPA